MEREPPSAEIIPLSIPKGAEKLCELCQREANLQCSQCQVTFYCHAEHQRADWVGIHERICQLLIPIRKPSPVINYRTYCIETQLKKAELIDICRSVAQNKLFEGKHQEALPAAQFCLRCSVDVHGLKTVPTVSAYLMLAQANMGLGNLSMVSEILSQVEWVVLQNPDCDPTIHQRLHRSMGQLHTATGNLDQALFHFANDIYYASKVSGVDSTVTCGGYFFMADVFAKQGKMIIARSLYSTVAHTWHSLLLKTFQNPDLLMKPPYDKAQQVEVDKMLRVTLEFEQNNSRRDSAQVALVAHCLAMLWVLGGDTQKALGFGSMALQASQLIPNHDLTEPIQGLLQLVQGLQSEPHPGAD